MRNKNILCYLKSSPEPYEIRERDNKRICTSLKFDKNGNSRFYCNNKCSTYEYIVFPMTKPLEIWIPQTMICNQCLNNLENKFLINFKEMIPKLYFEKGWICEKDFNYWYELKMIKSINEYFPNLSIYDAKLDPEMYWWNEQYCIIGLPIYWLKNFVIDKYIGNNSNNQGKYNGPDFIFKDTNDNQKIGLEIASINWNIVNSFKKIDQIEKYADNKVFNVKSFDERVNLFKKVVFEKSKKKYINCDELYLGIVVTDTIGDYEYFVLELILNKYIKDEKLSLSGVFIL